MYNIMCYVIVIYSTKAVMIAEIMVMMPMKEFIEIFILYFYIHILCINELPVICLMWFMKYLKLKIKFINA